MDEWFRMTGRATLLVVMACVVIACDKAGDGHSDKQSDSGVAVSATRIQNDDGHSLTVEFCSDCHAAPRPAAHSAREWPGVVARMLENMRRGGKPLPGPGQTGTILDYLQANAGPG